MKLTPTTKIYIVNNASPDSEWVDTIHETTLEGLRLRLNAGLDMVKDNVVVYTSKKAACADAKLRLIYKVHKP